MIELRWMVREDRRELQYRQWQTRQHSDGTGDWGQWQNVEHFIEFDNDPAQDTLPLEQGRIEPPA